MSMSVSKPMSISKGLQNYLGILEQFERYRGVCNNF
jgi:hypothetical protein